MSVVQLRNVVKKYGDRLSVDFLNLDVREGEIFALLGPNGAGKSTTIKMIAGLLACDQGEITVDGLSVRTHPLDVKRRIGLVPQDIAVYDHLTARENVLFFARLYGLRGKLLHERVDEALAFAGLSDRAGEKPSGFSGGMKRRLNIACAIMHRPKLIIMDEPTVGIDPQSRNHILESVRQLNDAGSTIIYTSHYMEEVEAISTRVGILDHGRLIALGTREELQRQWKQEEKISITVAQPNPEAVEEIGRHARVRQVTANERHLEVLTDSSQLVLQDILFILAKHQTVVRSITCVEPDLENLFLALTGRSLRD